MRLSWSSGHQPTLSQPIWTQMRQHCSHRTAQLASHRLERRLKEAILLLIVRLLRQALQPPQVWRIAAESLFQGRGMQQQRPLLLEEQRINR